MTEASVDTTADPALDPATDSTAQTSARPPRRWRRALIEVHGVPAFLLVVISAVITSMVDPGFGLNAQTGRTVMVILVVFLLLNYSSAVVKLLAGRSTGEPPTLVARPPYLLLVAALVVIARVIELDPPLVFGSVVVVSSLSLEDPDADPGQRRALGRAILLGSAWALALGVAGWASYTYFSANPLASYLDLATIPAEQAAVFSQTAGAAQLLIVELSFSLAVAALSSAPIVLLPSRAFEGGLLWGWSKALWGVTFLVTCAAYVLLLVPMPGSWSEVDEGRASAWFVGFAAYCVLAVALWVALELLRRKVERSEARAAAGQPGSASEK